MVPSNRHSNIVREKARASHRRRSTYGDTQKPRSSSYDEVNPQNHRRRRVSIKGRNLIQTGIPSNIKPNVEKIPTTGESRPRSSTTDDKVHHDLRRGSSPDKSKLWYENRLNSTELEISKGSEGSLSGYCAIVATMFQKYGRSVLGIEAEKFLIGQGIVKDWEEGSNICQRLLDIRFLVSNQDHSSTKRPIHSALNTYSLNLEMVQQMGKIFHMKKLEKYRRRKEQIFKGIQVTDTWRSGSRLPIREGDQIIIEGMGMACRIVPGSNRVALYSKTTFPTPHKSNFYIYRQNSVHLLAKLEGRTNDSALRSSAPICYGEAFCLFEARSEAKRGIVTKATGELRVKELKRNADARNELGPTSFVFGSPGKHGAVMSGDHLLMFSQTKRLQNPHTAAANLSGVSYTATSGRHTTSVDHEATRLVMSVGQASPVCWTVYRAVSHSHDQVARRRSYTASIWSHQPPTPRRSQGGSDRAPIHRGTRAARIPTESATSPTHGISVLVYNVWMMPSVVTAFSQRWMGVSLRKKTRAKMIPTCIPNASCDVVVLCEAFCNAATDILVRGLKANGFVFESPVCGTPHSSHMLKALSGGVKVLSKYPIVDCRTKLFGSLSCGDDSLADKGIVYTKIGVNDLAIHLIATHTQAWDTPSAVHVREKQFFLIREFIDNLCIPSHEPVIIAGDLNVDRINFPEQYARMLDLLEAQDLNDLAQTLVPSFDATNNKLAMSGPSSGGVDGLLDYVLVSKAHLCPRVFSSTIIPLKSEIGYEWQGEFHNDLSDHYPVLAHMMW